MQLHTEPNDELESWIAAGTPPIYFGFGSTPVQSPTETVAMIADACAELGERALIYSPMQGSDDIGRPAEHVKLVGLVDYSAILPKCRAVVHHGGAGTTAAGLRAGMPTLILWDVADQPIWAGAVQRLKVGSAKRFDEHHPQVAARRAPHYSCAGIRRPSPRNLYSDDQTGSRCRRGS